MKNSPTQSPTPLLTTSETDAAAVSKSKSSVQSLVKGLRVLEAFSHGAEEMTLTEIAAISGFDAGTTFRMVNTLADAGYVVRIPDSTRFRLSLRVLDLGFNAIARSELRNLVRPLLHEIVVQVGEVASYAVLEGGDVLYIERVQAGFMRLGVDIRIGTMLHAPTTLIGRTLLAFLPPDELERRLARPSRHKLATARNQADRSELDAVLAQVRKDGYLIGESMLYEGLRLLSVPVLSSDGRVEGAISVVAPRAYSTDEDLKARALTLMQESARKIAAIHAAKGDSGGLMHE